MSVDIDEYDRLYAQSRAAARAARKDAGAQAWKDSNVSFKDVGATEFVGYTDYSCDAEIKAIVTNGERDEFATADSEVVVVLDKTRSMARAADRRATPALSRPIMQPSRLPPPARLPTALCSTLQDL